MREHKFKRLELYELLWKQPAAQLAKELEIEVTHIRKICKHYNIPLPSSGYWTKLNFGKKVSIDKLYEIEKYESIVIDLKEPFEDEKDHHLAKLSKRTKEIENQFPSAIITKDRLSNPDPLIQKVKEHLSNRKTNNYWGIDKLIRTPRGFIRIEVSKALLTRALRFYDSFIKLLRLRGHIIKVDNDNTIITVYNQDYIIRLREKNSRVANTRNSYKSTDLIPNGKLSIKLDESYKTVEWTDGKTKLEDQLARLIAAIELKALKDIEYQKKLEISWAKQALQRKIEEEKQAKIKWEKYKVDLLLDHSRQWTESQSLIAFIEKIEQVDNLSEEQNNWISWARKVATSIDPLGKGVENLIEKYSVNHSNLLK